MTKEQTYEVIKALAYGLDEVTVAECNDITVEQVRAVAEENRAQVMAMRTELEEVYPDAF